MISTKGRYALRLMVDLAAQKDGVFVPLSDIAERQEISIKYLEIVVKSLVRAGLLQGHRGKGGGYKLTRPPEEYTVGEIIELAEGNLSPVACLAPGAAPCPREARCPTLPMWRRFDALCRDFLFGVTLRDLLEDEL